MLKSVKRKVDVKFPHKGFLWWREMQKYELFSDQFTSKMKEEWKLELRPEFADHEDPPRSIQPGELYSNIRSLFARDGNEQEGFKCGICPDINRPDRERAAIKTYESVEALTSHGWMKHNEEKCEPYGQPRLLYFCLKCLRYIETKESNERGALPTPAQLGIPENARIEISDQTTKEVYAIRRGYLTMTEAFDHIRRCHGPTHPEPKQRLDAVHAPYWIVRRRKDVERVREPDDDEISIADTTVPVTPSVGGFCASSYTGMDTLPSWNKFVNMPFPPEHNDSDEIQYL